VEIGEHLERRLTGILGTAQPEQQVCPPRPDLGQLALERGGQLLEIRRTAVHVEAQADQWRVGDPDVDVPRCCGSLRGSHTVIIAGR